MRSAELRVLLEAPWVFVCLAITPHPRTLPLVFCPTFLPGLGWVSLPGTPRATPSLQLSRYRKQRTVLSEGLRHACLWAPAHVVERA